MSGSDRQEAAEKLLQNWDMCRQLFLALVGWANLGLSCPGASNSSAAAESSVTTDDVSLNAGA